MKIQKVYKFKFDPEKMTDPELKAVFSDHISKVLWITIRSGHIVDQYFNGSCIRAASRLRPKPSAFDKPSMGFMRDVTDSYPEFMRHVQELSNIFGRVSIMENYMFHQTAIDNEFWGGVFRLIHGRERLNIEVVADEEPPLSGDPFTGLPRTWASV